MFVILTICATGYKDQLCFDDVESAAEAAYPFVISGGFDVRFRFFARSLP